MRQGDRVVAGFSLMAAAWGWGRRGDESIPGSSSGDSMDWGHELAGQDSLAAAVPAQSLSSAAGEEGEGRGWMLVHEGEGRLWGESGVAVKFHYLSVTSLFLSSPPSGTNNFFIGSPAYSWDNNSVEFESTQVWEFCPSRPKNRHPDSHRRDVMVLTEG